MGHPRLPHGDPRKPKKSKIAQDGPKDAQKGWLRTISELLKIQRNSKKNEDLHLPCGTLREYFGPMGTILDVIGVIRGELWGMGGPHGIIMIHLGASWVQVEG